MLPPADKDSNRTLDPPPRPESSSTRLMDALSDLSNTAGVPETGPFALRVSTAPPTLAGKPCAFALRVLDVANGISTDAVFEALQADGAHRGPSALRSRVGGGAGGVVLSSPPIDLELDGIKVGRYRTTVRVRLFDFGVAAIRFTLDLPDLTPAALIRFSAQLASETAFDAAARTIWNRLSTQLGAAVKEPSSVEFLEDYTIFVLPKLPASGKRGGDVIARMLMGEDDPRALAPEQMEDMWRRSVRYFEDDEVFIDYDAAVIVDPSCSVELVDILELATAHVLELRYYHMLANRASELIARDVAARGRASWLFRSPFTGIAERAARVVLEVGELTDRFERSITLIGDTHSVQVYKRAEERFRIAEARAAVHEKISIVARTAEVLTATLHARRGLLLEVSVIVLIALELIMAILRK